VTEPTKANGVLGHVSKLAGYCTRKEHLMIRFMSVKIRGTMSICERHIRHPSTIVATVWTTNAESWVAALISTQKTPLPYLTLLKRRSSRGSTSDTRRRLSFSIVDTADHYAHAENHAFLEELDTHYVRLVLGSCTCTTAVRKYQI